MEHLASVQNTLGVGKSMHENQRGAFFMRKQLSGHGCFVFISTSSLNYISIHCQVNFSSAVKRYGAEGGKACPVLCQNEDFPFRDRGLGSLAKQVLLGIAGVEGLGFHLTGFSVC